VDDKEPVLRRWQREKREWRAYRRRLDALPPDYRTVMRLVEKYCWNFAADSQIMPVLYGILDLFEEGAASGRAVLDVTGADVAGFVWSVLDEVRSATWLGQKGAQLNAQVAKALAGSEPPDAR
jgi:DNA-binding ferritin-like protein (Dps family)